MEDFLIRAMNGGAGAELEDAAGIGGDDGLGFRIARVVHFLRQQLERRLRFRDVVNSRGAAAMIGERHFDEFDAGDGANQFARGFADFLAVYEMAGILIA